MVETVEIAEKATLDHLEFDEPPLDVNGVVGAVEEAEVATARHVGIWGYSLSVMACKPGAVVVATWGQSRLLWARSSGDDWCSKCNWVVYAKCSSLWTHQCRRHA